MVRHLTQDLAGTFKGKVVAIDNMYAAEITVYVQASSEAVACNLFNGTMLNGEPRFSVISFTVESK